MVQLESLSYLARVQAAAARCTSTHTNISDYIVGKLLAQEEKAAPAPDASRDCDILKFCNRIDAW